MIRALSAAPSRDRIIELTTQHLGTDGQAAPVETVLAVENASSDARPLDEIMEHCRREVIQARLQQHRGNRASAARSLGLDRGNFHRLLKKMGLN